MWKSVLKLSSNGNEVIAQLPSEFSKGLALEKALLNKMLVELNAQSFFVDDSAVAQFIKCAASAKGEAFSGITIATIKDATSEVILTERDMIASIKVTAHTVAVHCSLTTLSSRLPSLE